MRDVCIWKILDVRQVIFISTCKNDIFLLIGYMAKCYIKRTKIVIVALEMSCLLYHLVYILHSSVIRHTYGYYADDMLF